MRLWFLKKLTLEFDELLTRSATGKLIDKLTVNIIYIFFKFDSLIPITSTDKRN